ncbi:MAG: FmdE family protein [Gemmatimonadota bacterium]
MRYEDLIAFHGHSCPGLATGYAMTRAALEVLGQTRAADEELVAIVENDACGVDALQCLSGCTFGKGNLIFRDYGKHVYTLYSRQTGRGVRVSWDRGRVPEAVRQDRSQYIDWLKSPAARAGAEVREVTIAEPEPAQVRASVPCARCGEAVMETRTRRAGGLVVCIPRAGEGGG